MSALFFKVSWKHNIDKYRELRKVAKSVGRTLTVKNYGPRGCPIFLFALTIPGERDRMQSFSSLDEVQVFLASSGESAS